MSSTNVHSKNLHICGGQTLPKEPEEGLDMPPRASGRGPAKIEVLEGPNTEISAISNVVVKDGDKVVGRLAQDGQVLSGDARKVREALEANKGMEK